MRYLIVMPRQTKVNEHSYYFPLGIPYVSASLKATNRDVISYNLTYKTGDDKELIRQIVKNERIDVIGVGGLTGQYWEISDILYAAKEANPYIITMVGGGIITSDPQAAMEALEIADYGMIGEGEITICELADAIEGKRKFEEVNGLIYRSATNDAWITTAPRQEIMDLDSIIFPDYEGFDFGEMMGKSPQQILHVAEGNIAYISGGRSCPFNCTFCFHPSGSRYRKRSLDSVFEEIDQLCAAYPIQCVNFSDELFSNNLDYVREFCRRIQARGLKFIIWMRVDTTTPEMIRLLKNSGCLYISYGLESADNTVLKSMRKNITIEQIERALSICKEEDMNAMGTFIFGDLAETTETMNRTLDWWKAHPEYTIELNFIRVYPGSHLYQVACKNGKIKDKVQFIKDGCPLINISKMTDEEFKAQIEKVTSLSHIRQDQILDAKLSYIGGGKTDIQGRCPHCQTQNEWRGQDLFRPITKILCHHCNKPLDIIAADYAGDIFERNLRTLSDRRIVLWGMINAVNDMVRIMPGLLDDHVFFVDASELKQGGKMCGKTIGSPDIIIKEHIDAVLIATTTPTAIDSIQYTIETNYPQVRDVWYIGDLMSPDFPRLPELP